MAFNKMPVTPSLWANRHRVLLGIINKGSAGFMLRVCGEMIFLNYLGGPKMPIQLGLVLTKAAIADFASSV
jgi:hypothetical protein